MSAAHYDLVIKRGARFDLSLQWVLDNGPPPVFQDLTGWSAKLQIREAAGAADPAIATLSTAGGGIVLGGIAGTILASWTAAQTLAMAADTHDAVWDLVLTPPGGEPQDFLEGDVIFRDQVTVLP